MTRQHTMIRPADTRHRSARRGPVSTLALAALAGVLAASVSMATPEGIPAQSRIVEVTVFPDRAEIVREGRVTVPAGGSTVEFANLPPGIEADSLRASASGVQATLGAVELKVRADKPIETPEYLAARKEVERLEAELLRLRGEGEVAKSLREFLDSIRAATAQQASEQLAEGKADPASISAVYGLLEQKMKALSEEGVQRNEIVKQTQRDLQIARAKLNTLKPAGTIRSRVASVEIEAQRAGNLNVRLEYLAPGASWRPAYRASLDPETGDVHLVSEAVVTQRTGEDWDGVDLKLSTASPARGVAPPKLTSWLLRPGPVPTVSVHAARERSFGKAAGAPAEMEMMLDEADAPAAPSRVRQAEVVRSAYNVAFAVPGRTEIVADGSDHRVVLRQEKLEGDVRYRAVPPLNESAYMVAKTVAPGGYPLLAGPVRVFAAGAYLGSFRIAETGPGEEMTLPFGVDNRIRVERTRLPRSAGKAGIIGKDREIELAFRTSVENLRDGSVEIVVEDRIPISEDQRIRVELGRETTEGWTEVRDRPGVLEWTLTLQPREKREITLVYSVRYPKDLLIPGL